MIEKRRIRFGTIEGLDRSDLPLAAEVWLDELKSQRWITCEIIRLGTLFVRYMADPKPELARLDAIERITQLDTSAIDECLRLMQLYGAVMAYSLEDGEVRVAMNLSLLQRLRVLESQARLGELMIARAYKRAPLPTSSDKIWLPTSSENVF